MWPPFSLDMFDSVPCQEKPTDEPLAVLIRHAAVDTRAVLQGGEHALHLVVGVGHSGVVGLLVGEKVR